MVALNYRIILLNFLFCDPQIAFSRLHQRGNSVQLCPLMETLQLPGRNDLWRNSGQSYVGGRTSEEEFWIFHATIYQIA